MSIKHWMGVSAAIAAVIAPAGAFAGLVTVAPLERTPAPALSGPALIGLALLLVSLAVVTLRRRSIGAATAVVAVLLVSGIGYAAIRVYRIVGDECKQLTEKHYLTGFGIPILQSSCPYPIRIVALDPECDKSLEPPGGLPKDCHVGDVPQTSHSCILPDCLG